MLLIRLLLLLGLVVALGDAGPGIDPIGRAARGDAGAGIDPEGRPGSYRANSDEGNGFDPHG